MFIITQQTSKIYKHGAVVVNSIDSYVLKSYINNYFYITITECSHLNDLIWHAMYFNSERKTKQKQTAYCREVSAFGAWRTAWWCSCDVCSIVGRPTTSPHNTEGTNHWFTSRHS